MSASKINKEDGSITTNSIFMMVVERGEQRGETLRAS